MSGPLHSEAGKTADSTETITSRISAFSRKITDALGSRYAMLIGIALIGGVAAAPMAIKEMKQKTQSTIKKPDPDTADNIRFAEDRISEWNKLQTGDLLFRDPDQRVYSQEEINSEMQRQNFALGKIYISLDDFDQAKTYVERALALEDDHPQLITTEIPDCLCLLWEKTSPEAQSVFDLLMEKLHMSQRDDWYGRNLIARQYIRNAKNPRFDVEKATAIMPDLDLISEQKGLIDYFETLAQIAIAEKDWERAIQNCDLALGLAAWDFADLQPVHALKASCQKELDRVKIPVEHLASGNPRP
jgi:hypothetical protein